MNEGIDRKSRPVGKRKIEERRDQSGGNLIIFSVPLQINATYIIFRAIVFKCISNFSQDLAEDIKGDTSGNFCEALKGLLHKPAEFDAQMLRNAIKVRLSGERRLEQRSNPQPESTKIAELLGQWTDIQEV